ncbi:VOC family protein [Brevibacterium linens]|uniref:VOC family protein n=1 Tax=Brevibacterium linens TaxID=1703 RepID=UPI003F8B0BEE
MPANPREGQPIWIDYVCQDFEAAQNFYTQLFGWEFADMGEDFGHYNMITKDGGNVGGAMRAMNMDGTPSPEMPTAWSTYLHTGDIAGTYQAALGAGAAEVVGPMPVGPLGQMAVVVDPTGSPIGMWQPGGSSHSTSPRWRGSRTRRTATVTRLWPESVMPVSGHRTPTGAPTSTSKTPMPRQQR